MMNTVFENDIFFMIYLAFKNLYPNKNCTCYWMPNIRDEENNHAFGVTEFRDDESIIVCVDPDAKICDAAEILAHELAHVAVGENNGHNEAWESAFQAIWNEYNRIGYEMYGKKEGTE